MLGQVSPDILLPGSRQLTVGKSEMKIVNVKFDLSTKIATTHVVYREMQLFLGKVI